MKSWWLKAYYTNYVSIYSVRMEDISEVSTSFHLHKLPAFSWFFQSWKRDNQRSVWIFWPVKSWFCPPCETKSYLIWADRMSGYHLSSIWIKSMRRHIDTVVSIMNNATSNAWISYTSPNISLFTLKQLN